MERQQDADAVEQELAGDGSLKKILTSTIHTIEDNKAQVFEIYETAKEEVEACRRQLNELKKQTREVIDRVDVLAVEEQKKKQELVRVSGNFAIIRRNAFARATKK